MDIRTINAIANATKQLKRFMFAIPNQPLKVILVADLIVCIFLAQLLLTAAHLVKINGLNMFVYS